MVLKFSKLALIMISRGPLSGIEFYCSKLYMSNYSCEFLSLKLFPLYFPNITFSDLSSFHSSSLSFLFVYN